ncbi:hypothetical protein [Streptomyces sp. NBC_01089]|uniref:hypothetical protein n=1 Tax=Streptomyces sp. NBC_01089 TaxID=2903747 RepID=UPI00386AC8ED|nr:hypothetical protein OG510_26610 [Streptomyces sp. NBC_01089]
MTSATDLRSRLIRIVIESADGELTNGDLAKADYSLLALNYSSLSYMRLIDAVENDLGVYLDPEADTDRFATVDGILGLIADSGGVTA